MHKNNIGTLRLVGAFLVLFGHSFALSYGMGQSNFLPMEWLRQVTPFKMSIHGFGIVIFFVLSGYLVTKSYALRNNFFEFTESRVLRIYPALIVCLVIMVFVVGPLFTSLPLGEYFSKPLTKRFFFENMTLLNRMITTLPGVFSDNPLRGVNGSLWTLPVEVKMYMGVAVLGLLGVLKSRYFLNCIVLILFLFWPIFSEIHPEHASGLMKNEVIRLAWFFVIGALFYLNFNEKTFTLKRLLIITAIMLYSYGTPAYVLTFSFWVAFLVMWVSFSEKVKLPDLSAKGDFSYGLYLYAFPLQQITLIYFGKNPWIIMGVSLVGAMFFAALSWFFVEKPAMKLKGKIAPKINKFLGIESPK